MPKRRATKAPPAHEESAPRKRKRAPKYVPTRRRAAWERYEEVILRDLWCVVDVGEIAKRLLRSASAVQNRARFLSLPIAHGLKPVQTAARESGYGRERLLATVAILKIRPRMIPRTDYRQAKRGGYSGLTDPEWARVFEYLRAVPDTERVYAPTATMSKCGEWGTGRKPDACLSCATTAHPHHGRGLCEKCYQAARVRDRAAEEARRNPPGTPRAVRAGWGNGGKPAACIQCSSTESPHHGRGLCQRCHGKARRA